MDLVLIWVSIQWENRTASDTFQEESFSGPTNVERDIKFFQTQTEAMDFYNREKSNRRLLGPTNLYWAYPQECDPEDIALIKSKIKKYESYT